MKHFTDPQGSDGWFAARKGVITGSRFKDARDRLADKPEKTDKKTGEVTPAQRGAPSAKQLGYAMDTARERVGGTVPPTYQNAAMRTGVEQEPHARMCYEAMTGNLVQEVGFITTDDGLFGLSPDGLVDDDGVCEIKTMVSSATLFQAVADGDISEYIDQCNGYLWLLGRQWVDLVLWCPDLEPLGLHITVKRITRDEQAIEALESDLMAFAALVTEYEAKLRAKVATNHTPVIESNEQAAFEQLERDETERLAKLNTTMVVEAPATVSTVVPMPVRAPVAQSAPATAPTLRLGQINDRLSPIQINADGLRALGFEPAATDRASKLYHEASFTHICAALVNHINSIQATQAA